MVGIGLHGAESSLARVSIVNWHGAVLLDEYVQQRERVVDYRTQYSGIREEHMVGAKPFDKVQKLVADMIQDRILVGHAVHNDLKVLFLSHPRSMLRDTQFYAYKFNLTKSKRIALRTLVKDQIGITIQDGEHDSVIDAQATMAIYRLHKDTWEKGFPSNRSKNTAETSQPGPSTKHHRRGESDKPRPFPDHPKQPNTSSGLDAISSAPSTISHSRNRKRRNPTTGSSTVIQQRTPNATAQTHTQGKEKVVQSAKQSTGAIGTGKRKAWWTR